jgi:hypothetical protein
MLGFEKTVGTAEEVMRGIAHHTSSGTKYTKDAFMRNKRGRIVTKKAHEAGLAAMQRLRASGKMAQPFTRSMARNRIKYKN